MLLLGGGGREHALGWKLSQSGLIDELISCPGNPGLATLGPTITDTDPTSGTAVVALAQQMDIDIVVIGPEAPLAAGVADALRKASIPVFGPGADGAMLESSKSFAKEVMESAGVPTAAARTFTDREEARGFVMREAGPYVVKANGLAAGKGVLVTKSQDEALAWVDACLIGEFADDNPAVVVEEWMDGEEVSVFFLCSGGAAVPLEPARDYKRLSDGDHGPNTGGMGAYSPVDDLPADLVDWTLNAVALPTLHELDRRGIEYVGFLYVGLMLTADGPRVVEFNCRLGDPETQTLMPRLESDLLAAVIDGLEHDFANTNLRWSHTATVNVVVAAAGYPTEPRKGNTIEGLTRIDDTECVVFHAGTRIEDTNLVTFGGRIVNIVGIGTTITEARSRAYRGVSRLAIDGSQHRSDIGQQREDTQ